MSKEKIKELEKLIKNTDMSIAQAMFNHQYEYSGNLRQYRKALLLEKEDLEKKLLENE